MYYKKGTSGDGMETTSCPAKKAKQKKVIEKKKLWFLECGETKANYFVKKKKCQYYLNCNNP